MRNNILKLLSCLCLMLISYATVACDCDSPADITFLGSIRSEIFELEVYAIDTIQELESYPFKPLRLIQLKVIRSFKSQQHQDYYWITDLIHTDCQMGLHPQKIGERYIITGDLYEQPFYNPWIAADKRRPFLYISSCGKPVLKVKQERVIGVLLKNNDLKISETYQVLKAKDPEAAKSYINKVYSTDHPDRVQIVSRQEFIRMLESKRQENPKKP